MSAMSARRLGTMGDDVAAGVRHFLILAGITARDPVSLAVLIFAGIVTIPAWTFGPANCDLLSLAVSPGPQPSLLVLAQVSAGMALVQLPWALLVAAAVARTVAPGGIRTAPRRAMPALPVGRRTRVLAEALAAMAFVLFARVAVLVVSGEHLGRHFVSSWPGLGYRAALALGTALGALFVFPMVLCWMAIARLDARGLGRPVVVTVVLLAAAGVGATARPWSSLLVALAVSALVLARLDDGERRDPHAGGKPARVRCRRSPGPLAQFRRDAWSGPLRRLWPLLAAAIPLPLAVAALLPRGGTRLLLSLAQLLALTALPFFPLGLNLTPSVTGSALFSGHFLRAWSTLPVPPERVTRATYLHGIAAAAVVWLVLCLQMVLGGGSNGLWAPAYGLPAVFLAGAIVLCEAVGDLKRGLLAVACLVGSLMVLPVAFVVAGSALGAGAGLALDGTALTVAAYALGLVGGLPPLVHLKR